MTSNQDSIWSERRWKEAEHPNDDRNEYRKDYSRVIHSAALRRLQSKTQVLGLGDSDFYRTRLTHSLEVAQIGVGLVIEISRKYNGNPVIAHLPDERLLEAICLSHDYGHPPFGHGGERALNFAMRSFGGFEGNAQTLRILSKLEKYSSAHGLNPTRRLLLGVLKYPSAYSSCNKNSFVEGKNIRDYKDSELKPPKCYYDCDADVYEWIIKEFTENDKILFSQLDDDKETKYKSLDCSIMDVADEISYSVHDLEDCLQLGLISKEIWDGYIKVSDHTQDLQEKISIWKERLFSSHANENKRGISNLVNYFVHSIEIKENTAFDSPVLRYTFKLSDEASRFRKSIQKMMFKEVIRTYRVRILESKGQMMVSDIFNAIASDPESFLPPGTLNKYLVASPETKMRVVCDYVSGMTDDYAAKMYQRFFTPKFGSVFDL